MTFSSSFCQHDENHFIFVDEVLVLVDEKNTGVNVKHLSNRTSSLLQQADKPKLSFGRMAFLLT